MAFSTFTTSMEDALKEVSVYNLKKKRIKLYQDSINDPDVVIDRLKLVRDSILDKVKALATEMETQYLKSEEAMEEMEEILF